MARAQSAIAAVRLKSWITLVIATVLGLTASIAMEKATSNGLGFSPDSVSYYAVAQGIAAGDGFVDARRYNEPSRPNYPPGYSSLIAAAGLFGDDLRQSTRSLHILLAGLTAGLIFVLGLQVTRTIALGMIAALIFLGLRDTYVVSRMMWSEPSFTVFVLGFACSMLAYVNRPRLVWLVLATLCAFVAASIRMPGVSLAFSGGLCILFYSPGPRFTRFIRANIFGAIAIAPTLAWLVRNTLVIGDVYADRPPSLMAFNAQNFQRGGEVLLNWTGEPNGINLLLAALVAAGIWLAFHPNGLTRKLSSKAWQSLLIIIGIYFAIMAAGVISYGLSKPFDARLFFPVTGIVIVAVLYGALQLISFLLSRTEVKLGNELELGAFAICASAIAIVSTGLWLASSPLFLMPLGVAVLAVGGTLICAYRPSLLAKCRIAQSVSTASIALLCFLTWQTASLHSQPYNRGIETRVVPNIIEAYRALPTDLPVFSNYDDRAYMFAERQVLRLPRLYSVDRARAGERAENYKALLASFEARVSEGAYVMYLLPNRRFYLPGPNELAQLMRLEETARTEDGVIYYVPPQPADLQD